ncbi:50S ribosomal protein L11 methyltransferase [Sphingomonas astaxanthinifaciens]|uniref:Ribosomal protein L11 methyltransferase n=1 Tax=Sphingomonas astaxanthinifaciens DSM 22298 TaxID=1123267 RepID=A0ABQ5Z5M4_9SPHN|nr:50S ribosomal protein L11 methyltransferase [Sphingomonas astaxanthinifaciens]GLR47325.1 ribosomal protein L11 methyltransferase [Sphingomonas astaxanthinifaciens DSM 22298]
MSWRVTIPCNRAEGEAIGAMDDPFPDHPNPPVIVADEPDEDRPDEWVIHAYFEEEPGEADLAVLRRLASGEPSVAQLEDEDWVTRSQAGLEPIRAGRFHVHTPAHAPDPGSINFLIDAGLAFGTGHHHTTKGCLEALDRLERAGRNFSNIADIGTGTGLLAFGAMRLWPEALAIATDIDPVSIDVTRDNAVLNRVPLGEGKGALALAVADGMGHPALAERAPFDLLIANILAGPLIELAEDFVAATAPGGTILLAGLLDTQADAVTEAYTRRGCRLVEGGQGEWRVLVLERT